MRALATRSAMRGSSRNSSQRPSGRSVMASRPSSSACHISSGVFMSPGKRVAMPTMAMSSTSSASRDQSSSSADVVDLRLALDDDRGQRLDGRMPERDGGRQRHAGEVLDVAGHRHRVARGQAELDHRRGLVDRVGDWPVALAIQLRSHSRISATVMSVRAGGSRRPAWASTRPEARESSCASVMFSVLTFAAVAAWFDRMYRGVSQFRRGRRWRPSRCAGCRRGTRRGRRGGRSCRWRYAGSHPPGSAARRAR